MGASPESFLTKLAPGVEVAAGKVRGLATAVEALAAAGLVTMRKDGRTLLVALTEAGTARAAQLAATTLAPKLKVKTTRPATTKPATATQRLAALEAAVIALVERVATLEGRAPAGDATRPGAGAGNGNRAGDEAIRTAVLAAVGELDARHRAGGLVPIPDVRAELRRTGVTADDATVTAALEALERAWKIDLSVAQAPTQVADRAAGIERPGRGLLYYVARR